MYWSVSAVVTLVAVAAIAGAYRWGVVTGCWWWPAWCGRRVLCRWVWSGWLGCSGRGAFWLVLLVLRCCSEGALTFATAHRQGG